MHPTRSACSLGKHSASMVALLFVLALFGSAYSADFETVDIRMPDVIPDADELYLCTAIPVNPETPAYITGYVPHGSMMTAHHMLLYGCAEPGALEEEVWNCGEMRKGSGAKVGPVCGEGSQILYAWGRDAPKLDLPEGVGFKVGGNSGVNYLVLQVHYMHKMDKEDNSGLTLHYQEEPVPREAGVILMVTGGEMKPKSEENFDTACMVAHEGAIHPFAFRVHAHRHGQMVSGYRVTDGEKWDLLGKQDPMKAQMFNPVADPSMVLEPGDVIASRCHMKNTEDHTVRIGSTGDDEMCNFYLMYYVDGENTLRDYTCFSPGPPDYRWENQGLKNIPE